MIKKLESSELWLPLREEHNVWGTWTLGDGEIESMA